jgi:hypothetical protein
MIFMAVRIAQGLVIASLVLLIIYGADASAKQGEDEGGFLPIDTKTRGISFGVPPIIMSTIAFFISRKERSSLVSVLLLVNGALIMIGGIMPIAGGKAELGSPILVAGIWVLALGIVKSVRARAVRAA